MSVAYVGNASAYTASATELDWTATFNAGLLLVAVYAFQGVAAGSGPWSIPNTGQYSSNFIGPNTGWLQVAVESPSSTGVGIEVWAAVNGPAVSFTRKLAFSGTHQCQVAVAAYSGEYAPNGVIGDGAVRVATAAQVVGNQPSAPSIFAFTGEQVIAVGGDLMGASGFGTPPGYTNRVDAAGGGAGNAEATVADATAGTTGNTGLITFPNNAATGTTPGATATLAIRPATVTPLGNEVLTAGFPQFLDLPDGYVLVWDAVDATGASVPGVTVSSVSVFGTALGDGIGSNETLGPFMLVPGPGA